MDGCSRHAQREPFILLPSTPLCVHNHLLIPYIILVVISHSTSSAFPSRTNTWGSPSHPSSTNSCPCPPPSTNSCPCRAVSYHHPSTAAVSLLPSFALVLRVQLSFTTTSLDPQSSRTKLHATSLQGSRVCVVLSIPWRHSRQVGEAPALFRPHDHAT